MCEGETGGYGCGVWPDKRKHISRFGVCPCFRCLVTGRREKNGETVMVGDSMDERERTREVVAGGKELAWCHSYRHHLLSRGGLSRRLRAHARTHTLSWRCIVMRQWQSYVFFVVLLCTLSPSTTRHIVSGYAPPLWNGYVLTEETQHHSVVASSLNTSGAREQNTHQVGRSHHKLRGTYRQICWVFDAEK